MQSVADASSPRSWQLGLAFAAIAAAVYSGSRFVASAEAFAARPDWLGVAVAVDLAFILPAAYYFLLVRGAGLPGITTVPVFVIGLVLAATVLPSGHPAIVVLGLAALPAEVLLAGVLAYKARALVRAYRRAPAGVRFFDDSLPVAARDALGSSRVVDAIVSEVMVLYFAIAVWRRAPGVPAGARAYTSHRDTGWGAVFFALALVVVVEIAIVHLVVSQWSDVAAWVLTGLGLYGLIWLSADYRAMALRPTLLTDSRLLVRIGMRWFADVPVTAIRRIRRFEPADRRRGLLRLTALGDPQLVLELDRPVEIRGLFGVRRTASALALTIDGSGFAGDIERVRRVAPTANQCGGPDVHTQPRTALPSASGLADIPGARALLRWLVQPMLRQRRVPRP